MPKLTVQKLLPALAIAFAAFVTACSDANAPAPKASASLPAAAISTETPSTVVGTVPAGPTAEAAGTTSAAKTDVSKNQQSTEMPLPGQANDHSTLSPAASQKAGTVKK